MVIDRTRGRRRDGNRADDRPDRGQVILIGAVALAFIVLGVVVVFNGVVYTETLTSADTGQSAGGADRTELEVKQGISCLISEEGDGTGSVLGDGSGLSLSDDSELEREIEEYDRLYRNATAHSRPAAVNVSYADGSPMDLFEDGVDVTIRYDATDHSYERSVTVTANACPRGPSIDEFDVTSSGGDNHTVDWTVSSGHSGLSSMNVSVYDGDVVVDSETPDVDGAEESGETDLAGEGDEIRITVRNEAGYVATEREEV